MRPSGSWTSPSGGISVVSTGPLTTFPAKSSVQISPAELSPYELTSSRFGATKANPRTKFDGDVIGNRNLDIRLAVPPHDLLPGLQVAIRGCRYLMVRELRR